MKKVNLIHYPRQVLYPLNENEYEGVALHWTEIQSTLKKWTDGNLEVPLSTLRWYQHKGVIEKPNRGASGALYSYETLYDLRANRTLRYHFNLSIARIIEIKKTGAHLYSVAWVLQHLEQLIVNHYLAPNLSDYIRILSREFVEMDDPGKVIPHSVSVQQLKDITNEWNSFATGWQEIRETVLQSVHDDYFELIKKGSNPLEIGIEFLG